MAKQAPDSEKLTPPYISFTTFKTFIEALKNTTVPPRIDSSLMPTMSGQVRGALMSCLRFLKLVENDSTNVTPLLEPLVEAYGSDKWEQALAGLIQNSSYKVFTPAIDLKRATGGQLLEVFRVGGGVDGQVLEKAIRFYLAALDEAKIPYSPLFKERGAMTIRKKGAAKLKPKKANEAALLNDEIDIASQTPALDGLVPFVVSFPDKAAAKFWLPKNITEADWALVDTIGRAYVKRTSVKVE